MWNLCRFNSTFRFKFNFSIILKRNNDRLSTTTGPLVLDTVVTRVLKINISTNNLINLYGLKIKSCFS